MTRPRHTPPPYPLTEESERVANRGSLQRPELLPFHQTDLGQRAHRLLRQVSGLPHDFAYAGGRGAVRDIFEELIDALECR